MPRHRLYVIQSTDGKWFWDPSSTIKGWSYGDTLGFAQRLPTRCSPSMTSDGVKNNEVQETRNV